ncbi:MAG: hypothetical protein FWG85_00490 [Bacteroidetes bacterium]|nr:hypothetical protein [Bacteroidota bacterium]
MKIKIILVMSLIFAMPQIANAQFGGGAGTIYDPYQITQKEHLEILAELVAYSPLNDSITDYNWSRDKYFILMNDIDEPISTIIGEAMFARGVYYNVPGYPFYEYHSYLSFQGNFNGNYNKINLAINKIRDDYIGLFGSVAGANIRNLTVDGYVYGSGRVGGVVGSAFESRISNCTNYANIRGAYLVGGIVGGIEIYSYEKQTTNSEVSNCTNYGYISGNNERTISFLGGIIGGSALSNFRTYHSVFITNNTNYGDVKGSETIGGIIGCANLEGTRPKAVISNCANSGNIVGVYCVGGITGHFHQNVEINNSINIGTITSTNYGGGIAGGGARDLRSKLIYDIFRGNTDIFNCVNSGLIVGVHAYISRDISPEYIGGILGHPEIDGEIRNCINTGVIIYSPSNNRIGAVVSSFGDGAMLSLQNNHYDKQMCIYGGIRNEDILGMAEGHLTKEMIGWELQDKLGDEDWVYADNLYPTLKFLENHTIAKIARSPAYLDDEDTTQHPFNYRSHGYDVHCNIRKCFSVNIENNVVWTKTYDNVSIVPKDSIYDIVFLEKLGEDVMYSGIFTDWRYVKKTIPITIADISKPCDLFPRIFNLVLKDNPEGSATLIGEGEYEEGEYAIYEAIPNDCYTFINWTDSITGEEVSANLIDTILMDMDYTLIANFIKNNFELITKANPEEGGTAIGSGIFECNEYAIYEAIPNDCYTFINWTDGTTGQEISTKLIDTIFMDRDYTLIANFIINSFELITKANPEEGGTAIGSGVFNCNEYAIYQAIPNACYIFTNWTDSITGNVISTKLTDTILMNRNRTLIANFVIESLTLITKPNPEEGGTTIGSGIFECGEYAEYIAIPNECYRFINWTDSITGDVISTKLTDTILMDGNWTLIANFEEIKYILDVRTDGNGSVQPDGVSIRNCDEVVIITAEPNSCYIFKEWVDINNNFISNSNPLEVMMVSDSILIATFENTEVFITIRWDSVMNKTPDDTISLTATIESISRELIFDSVHFNIGMDYKLFVPKKLFLVSDDIEYPLDFNFSFATGIDAKIGHYDFKTGERFLRLEGMTLMSLPTATPVFFNKFDIINTLQCNYLTLLEGYLDVSNFCGSDWRGGIIFVGEFDVEIEQNPIHNNTLKLNFNATGDVVVDVEIFDIDGKIIITDIIKLAQGNTIKEINLGDISAGSYLIIFNNPFNPIVSLMFIVTK